MKKRLLSKLKKIDKEIIIIFLLAVGFFYKLFLNPSQMISPARDIVSIYYHFKDFLNFSLFNGQGLPLWDPYIFSGMPFIANPESAIFSPFNILYLIFPVSFAFGFSSFINTFLIGTFTYLFAKLIKISKISSLLSAVIMMFSGPFIILIFPGHTYILDTITWFPILLYIFEVSFLKNKLIYSVFAGFVLGFIGVAGHIQPGVYGFLTAFSYLVLRIIVSRDKSKIKILLLPILSSIIAFFIFEIQLIPLFELFMVSDRAGGVSYIFASDFSLPLKQLIGFILPNFFGNPVINNYWGRSNFWSTCGYLGVIPLILTIFAIYKGKNIFTYIFSILGIFALLFSLGKYSIVFPFFYNFVPFFNDFRVPARFLYIYAFSLAILSGIGFDKLIKLKRTLLLWLGKIFLITGLFFITLTLIFNFIPQKISYFERYLLNSSYAIGISRELIFSQIIQDLFIFWIIIILFSAFLILKSKYRTNFLNYFLIFLVISNLWFYWQGYYTTKALENVFPKQEVIEQIKKDSSTFRVFDQTGLLISDLEYARLENVLGISAALSSTYREFFHLTGAHSDSKYDVFIDIKKITNLIPLKLLNVKYLITKQNIENDSLNLKLKGINNLYEITDTLPRVYVIPNGVTVKDTKEALQNIKDGKFDLKSTILIEDYPSFSGDQIYKEIAIKNRSSDKIILNTFSSKRGFLVLSEIYYPGWKAFDNSKELKIYKGDGLVRVLPLSSGTHNIKFVYDPLSYTYGKYISIISVLLIIVFIYLKRRKF